MATTVNLTDANAYFDTEVLHSKPWENADDTIKQKALNNAERVLYREFPMYDIEDETKYIPLEAVYEQALWMLRQDDAIQKSEMGVMQVSVKGISVLTDGKGVDLIAPESQKIINEDLSNRDDLGDGFGNGPGWLVM